MKYLILLLALSSCSVINIPNKKEVPAYTTEQALSEALIESHDIPMPKDTNKVIIVYNVVEKEQKNRLISDETIRLFVADLFGTVTTYLTIRQIDNTP